MASRISFLDRELLLISGLGLASLVAASFLTRTMLHLPLALALLALLALVAEFLPVQVSRDGIRITLSLPFIAGVVMVAGPLTATAVDVLITVAAAIAISRRRHEALAWKWLWANLAIAVLACTAAGLATYGVDRLEPQGVDVLEDLAFVVIYAFLNFVLVTRLNSHVSNRSFSDNVVQSLRPGVVGLGLYCLVALGVSVLLTEGQILWLPIMIVPVLALRHGIAIKARQYENYYETVAALSMMLQRTNPQTHNHLERVAQLAHDVGLRLGLSSRQARLVRAAALLHDIGKIAIDEAILDKPDRLSESEMEHVRLHAEYGALILEQCDQLRPIVPWVRAHHERPDGTGYPHRLQDVEIPIQSKIISVVDAFDAMVGGEGERAYRRAMSQEEALAELQRCAGSQFDPAVVVAFVRTVREAEVAA